MLFILLWLWQSVKSFAVMLGWLTEIDVCMEAVDVGPCNAALARFYFDVTNGACREFVYGGCGGNSNRFNTLEECEYACVGSIIVSSGKLLLHCCCFLWCFCTSNHAHSSYFVENPCALTFIKFPKVFLLFITLHVFYRFVHSTNGRW